MSEKYSVAENCTARRAINGPKKAIISVAKHPAAKDPRAATASAAPPRPRRAMACPSRQVTTDDESPGMSTRMAVVETPYWDPENLTAGPTRAPGVARGKAIWESSANVAVEPQPRTAKP